MMNTVKVNEIYGMENQPGEVHWFELFNYIGNWDDGLSTTLYDVAFPNGDHPEHHHDWTRDASLRGLTCPCGYYWSDRMMANDEPPHPPYLTEADGWAMAHDGYIVQCVGSEPAPASEFLDWYNSFAESGLMDSWGLWDDIIYPNRDDNTYNQSGDDTFFSNCVYYVLGQGWYFWDETWTEDYGPYETEALAHDALVEYCKTI